MIIKKSEAKIVGVIRDHSELTEDQKKAIDKNMSESDDSKDKKEEKNVN